MPQLLPGDELLLDVNDERDWGHAAMNRKMLQATGDYLLFLDDDNVFVRGALDAIRRTVVEPDRAAVHIYRMRYRENGFVLWQDEDLREGNVAGQMVVVDRSRVLANWTARYEGDFDFIRGNVDFLGDPVWHREIIAEVSHPDLIAKIGIVITACAGRENNLRQALDKINQLRPQPTAVVVVIDGTLREYNDELLKLLDGCEVVSIPKHQPGHEQPRNVGFTRLRQLDPGVEYCWFLDSDLLVAGDALRSYADVARPDRILVGPYDWLPPGRGDRARSLRNDIRWPAFERYAPTDPQHGVHAFLACLGGNIVWPVEVFSTLGGFSRHLYHGRCEDGELALRAHEHHVPVGFVRDARAWHLHHPVNLEDVYAKNRVDNPKLLDWHPWLADEGFVLVDEDGTRFDYVCPVCGEQMNCHYFWEHRERHERHAHQLPNGFEPPVLAGWNPTK